jgi:uncharacterized membrane protein
MATATHPIRAYGGRERRIGYSGGQQRMPSQPGQPESGFRQAENAERHSRGLGWFSIALGLAEIASPGGIARLIGVPDEEETRDTLFAVGLREIASGLGILARPQSAGWLWARVGGDVMDLALLGSALRSDRSDQSRVAAATAAVVGVTALDYMVGQELSRSGNGSSKGHRMGQGQRAVRAQKSGRVQVTKAITINRPVNEIYGFWRNFQNLPRFMDHLESVQVLDDRRSRWKAKAPAGTTVEWEAEINEDRPDQLISWRSLPDATVTNAGAVRFSPAPGNRGTEIIVDMRYDPPGGIIGAAFAKLFGEEPNQQVEDDLRRFKQVIETGEIVRSDASIHKGPHPARPAGEHEVTTRR